MSVQIHSNTHTATAQVGKDTIENAEYIIFSSEWWNRPKRDLSFKDKVSRFWFKVTFPFRRLKGKIEYMFWQVRYGFERMFNGYDSVDCFETFAKFTERYYKILTEYKKNHYGYPGTMSEEEWEDIVDEMIYHLYYMDQENVEKELCKDVPEDWIPSCLTVDDIMERHKDEFFKLFSEHFYSLWD